MGQEILYCNKCGRKLLGDDFTRGRAHTFNNRQYCATCLPQDITTGSHKAIKEKPTSRTKKRAGSSRTARAPANSNGVAIIVGVAAAAIVMVVLIAAVTSSKVEESAPAPIAKSAPPEPVKPPPAAPRPDPALAVREKEKAAVERKELEEKVETYLKNEQYGAALDLLGEARKRRDSVDWTAPIAKRIQELESMLTRIYPPVREKGNLAQLRGSAAEVQVQRTRLVIWGRKELIDDFDRMIAETLPHEPLPPGAVVLLRYPNPDPVKYTLLGDVKSEGLVGVERFGGPCIGFESGRDILTIPEEGEVRVVYTTTSPSLLTVVLRATAPDGKNYPFNCWLKNPEVGKPQLLKCPISQLKDWTNKLITKGAGVNNIYVRQEEKAGVLTIHEFVIFRTKE